MIKIGIDPSGTGTTGIVVYEDNKIIEKQEFFNKKWKKHYEFIDNYTERYWYKPNENGFCPYEKDGSEIIINIEDCLYTGANGSKDRDDLLRLLGSLHVLNSIIWVSPRYTKSVVNKIEYKSKFLKENPHLNDNFGDIKICWEKDDKLYYEFGKSWFYNNEKISHHIRDAIIIANYKG